MQLAAVPWYVLMMFFCLYFNTKPRCVIEVIETREEDW